MSPKFYQIQIRREPLKFAAAHMTVFPDGTKESLHGHNYTTDVTFDMQGTQLQDMVSFSYFKKIMKGICDQWDEKVLLPKHCPYFSIQSQTLTETEFTLCNKRYVLPTDEIELLETDNITSETLALLFCNQLVSKIDPGLLNKTIHKIHVKIEETPGQGAIVHWPSL
jgi:6-pyruvoyltetrahydropterin/6-carboxytetrahydropterin synthase